MIDLKTLLAAALLEAVDSDSEDPEEFVSIIADYLVGAYGPERFCLPGVTRN